jgi:hypothetical protein
MDNGEEEFGEEGMDQAATDEEDEILLLEMFKEECWAEARIWAARPSRGPICVGCAQWPLAKPH